MTATRWPWSHSSTDTLVRQVADELLEAVTELEAEVNKLSETHPPQPPEPEER